MYSISVIYNIPNPVCGSYPEPVKMLIVTLTLTLTGKEAMSTDSRSTILKGTVAVVYPRLIRAAVLRFRDIK